MGFNRHGQFLDDLLNFIESWIHYSLYLKRVYPDNFFQVRSVFGLQIKVVKEGILYEYIHKMVEDVKEVINSVSELRLNFINAGVVKEYCQLSIDKSKIIDKMDTIPLQFERDHLFKSILHSMSQKL